MSKLSFLMALIVLSMTFVACTHENGDSDGHVIPDAVMDVDGNYYDAVEIGDQVWMRSNLRTRHFRDGQPIPQDNDFVYTYTEPYLYELTIQDVPTYDEKMFGLFYNWPAVVDVRGLCPDGWHVPSDKEWKRLERHVSSKSEFVYGSHSDNIAKSLASQMGWVQSLESGCPGNDPESNNATGFSAFPAGHLYDDDFGFNSGYFASFWSASERNGEFAWARDLHFENALVKRGLPYKYEGFSVRCVRD